MSKAGIRARVRELLPAQKGSAAVRQPVLWVALFSVLYVLRDVVGMGVPSLAFTAVSAMAFLFMDVGSAMGVYIFTSALTVPHNEIRLVYLAIVALKLIRGGGFRLHGPMTILTLGLMALQLVNTALYSREGFYGLVYSYVIKMLVFILPLIWYSTHNSVRHCRRAMLLYMWGVLLGGTVALILTSRMSGFMNLLLGNRFARLGRTLTETTESMQTTYNANQLAAMLAIAIAVALTYMDRRYLPRAVGLVIIGYSLMLILMTKSRTGLLTAGGVAVLYYWVIVVRKGRLRQGVVIFAAMLLVIVLVVNLIPEVVTAAVGRFVNQTDITNGRSDLLLIYLKEWTADPWCFLFGYGIGSYKNKVDTFNVPHNSIADILICWGAVGLLLVAAVLVLMYRRHRRGIARTDVVLAYLPAIAALVASLAGQYTTAGWPHMRLCLLLLAAKGFRDETQREQQPTPAPEAAEHE